MCDFRRLLQRELTTHDERKKEVVHRTASFFFPRHSYAICIYNNRLHKIIYKLIKYYLWLINSTFYCSNMQNSKH